jgi:heme-degrading monooxygenase HmoA
VAGPTLGFAVIYRWKVNPSKEEQFWLAWEEVTKAIRQFDGGLGSRLHKASDGTWLAYAQWPSREMWKRAGGAGDRVKTAMHLLNDAIEERLPHIELEPIADHLVPSLIS